MGHGETVDLVDESDEVVGSATIDVTLGRGLLHRAVAVVVRRGNGNIVLQRRSLSDRWHPGLWTLSSTGHVKTGEDYAGAAARELREELGLMPVLAPLGRLRVPPITDGELTENEWVSLFEADTDDECTIDKTEVDSVREYTPEGLGAMMRSGQMTPDSVTILMHYFAAKESNRS